MKNILGFCKKHSKIILISCIALVVISLITGTYAMFQRIDEAEYANSYKTGNLQIEFDDTSEGLGGVISIDGAVPMSNADGASTSPYKVKIKNTGNLDYQFDLKLVVDSTYVSSHGCEDMQLSADYIMIKVNDKEPVVLSSLENNIIDSDILLKTEEDLTYELRVWLKEGTPNSEIGKHYHAKLTTNGNAIYTSGGYYVDSSNANAPVLASGMIPVMYDETTSNWVKADYYDATSEYAGYDYSNKKWANAVMVSTSTRETYMNADVGTTVLESDILSYFVWIPRYKYKLFNADYASDTTEQLIEVEFESGTSTTGTVTCSYADDGTESCTNKVNGNWYTHPAFTFGGDLLKGIWVGKFETTGSETSPTVKPNTISLRSITVSQMYSTAQLFKSTNYLTKEGASNIDSHMMKNIEWGAVAYLKQSAYGLGITDITMNSNSSFYTGGNDYKTNVDESTTGNITGVYDMSGGADEYVMGNYGKNAGSSGLTVSNVASKYIDIYAGDDASSSHLGDATGETSGWYYNYADFISSSFPWFMRGDAYSGEETAGIFYFNNNNGNFDTNFGFRVILTTIEE